MHSYPIRPGKAEDIAALLELENLCFDADRFNRRSFLRWLQSGHALFRVAEAPLGGQVLGYGLVVLQQGTRLSRLYSLAVNPAFRRRGIASQLLADLEQAAAETGRLAMRLEVGADDLASLAFFRQRTYRAFEGGEHPENSTPGTLRLQKGIRHPGEEALLSAAPWFQQRTPFTCGPASLLMAMEGLRPGGPTAMEEELDIWREATTIFMTSGHGGCHPFGLALSAHRRGFRVQVWLKHRGPLFLEGVRSEEKKEVLKVVHRQFRGQVRQARIPVHLRDITPVEIEKALAAGSAVLLLISTYRFNGRKAPHWVLVTAMDEYCLYVHDPDPEEGQRPIDCQHVPIARSDFDSMISYGSSRLKTALVLQPGQ